MSDQSRFHALKIEEGMPREEVERLVATASGKESQYSPNAGNLSGGWVEYHDGGWILKVNYAPGTPGPYMAGPDGQAIHFPPIDESVIEFSIEMPA